MHEEYAKRPDPCEPPPGDGLLPLDDGLEVVVVVELLAALGDGLLRLDDGLEVVVVVELRAALGDDPPPQAATVTPTARIPAATNTVRRSSGRRRRWG